MPKKNVTEKFLKEIKGATPVDTQIIRKPNNLWVDLEKVVVVCTEDQIRHHIPLSQSLVQKKTITLFKSTKAEKSEVLQKKSLKLTEVGSWGLRKDSRLYNMKVQDEATVPA